VATYRSIAKLLPHGPETGGDGGFLTLSCTLIAVQGHREVFLKFRKPIGCGGCPSSACRHLLPVL